MEKELTAAVTTQEPMLADSLIVVQQLPVIKEQLHSIKAQAQASVAEALALVCTEETLKVVKEQRAKLNRDRKDLDDRRAVVKKQIMKPFEDFDKVYKECVTDVYGPADEALKGKITDVEAGLKADKEKKVVAYFDELVKANGVEWVSYGDIGIAVTMTASLKSLKSKVKEYIDHVVADVNCMRHMRPSFCRMSRVANCGRISLSAWSRHRAFPPRTSPAWKAAMSRTIPPLAVRQWCRVARCLRVSGLIRSASAIGSRLRFSRLLSI